MKLEIVKVSRRPSWPLWACLLIVLWLAFGAAALFLGAYLERPVHLCLFKNVTGLACPTCGVTRGVLCLLHGRFAQAWLYNPLMLSAILLFSFYTPACAFLGRSVRVQLNQKERTIAWVAAVGVLVSNWAYVILCVG